ncbi:MAG: hypothetical protein ABR548_07440 [Actinomycetota bacterium]
MKRLASLFLIVMAFAGAPVASHADVDLCTSRLLVLSAFPGEIDKLLTEENPGIGDVVTFDNHTFYAGDLRGNQVVLGLTGIGLVNARETATAAIHHFRCGSISSISGIVFSGVSGGMSSIGDVTIPKRWTDGTSWVNVDAEMMTTAKSVKDTVQLASAVPTGDPACVGIDPRAATTVEVTNPPQILVDGDGKSADPFGGRQLPCFPGGGDVFGCRPCRAPDIGAPDPMRLASQAIPFADPNFFFDYFSAPPGTPAYQAEDMETAAVAQVANANTIPFIAFRALSDGLGDPLHLPGFPFQFFYYRQLAADNAAEMTLAFLQAWSTH